MLTQTYIFTCAYVILSGIMARMSWEVVDSKHFEFAEVSSLQ